MCNKNAIHTRMSRITISFVFALRTLVLTEPSHFVLYDIYLSYFSLAGNCPLVPKHKVPIKLLTP